MTTRDLVVAAAGNAGATSDNYFKNVSLLLSGDGTNGTQNNTFVDSSSNNFTITRNGNTTQGSFSPYGNLWSTYTDPAATRANLEFSFSGSPFETAVTGTNYTIEAWVNRSYDSGNQYQCVCSSSGDRNNILTINSTNTCQFKSNGGDLLFSPTASTFFPIGEWVHFALVCQGTTWTLYRNGVSQGTASGSKTTNGGTMYVLGRNDMNNFGYISNFRVSNSARYTTNFTPSTTPLTVDSNTVMLLSSTNRGTKDISANNQQFTQNGTISTTRFSPFNPTAPYSTSTIGGSGYFDGSGDYLTVPAGSAFAPGTGSFTVECWIYPTTANEQLVFTQTVSGYNYFLFGVTGTTGFVILSNAVLYGPSNSLQINQWNHIAAVRNGNSSVTVYVNGVGGTTGSNSINLSNTSYVPTISGYTHSTGTTPIVGYISNLRYVNGTAVYTSNFTPPTTPLTAITNTSLLCNFTNAGIPDAAMMNDLETVGNAQVSTSVVKYGTGSLAFDGTGDYLKAPDSPLIDFGSGDLTIECWLYPTSLTATDRIIIGKYTGSYGTTSFWIGQNGTTLNAYFYYPTSQVFSMVGTGALTINTWQHIAVTRSGSAWKLFVNGTSVASTTQSVTLQTNTTPLYIGGDPTYSQWYLGYIDDLRITKGYARYTANFTPPAQALPTQ